MESGGVRCLRRAVLHVLSSECRVVILAFSALNPKRKPHQSAFPVVLVSMAMSADGKIATANRVVSTLGSERDRRRLLELRAGADAVMAGARTADLNSVNLGPGPLRYRRQRVRTGLAEYNLRVIVSGAGTLDPNAEVFAHRFSPIIVLTTGRISRPRLERLRAVADVVRICGRRTIDFRRALRWLRSEWGVKRLLGEGGGALNGALFAAGLINELHLTVCPKVVGGRKAPTIADGPVLRQLRAATRLTLVSSRRRGDEWFLTYRVKTAR
jgi:2,5-diamino-6-(ribosylamino)-4(3H)-pyrimidinone 5'-phosphate reductase